MEAIDADFSKTYLFPPAIEDFVPPDHPARFIREFAEYALSEVKIEWKESSGVGRPPYAAGLLLRVWLYGYLHKITSLRKLEAACREHVSLLWLTGFQAPDHNSLWRFWKANRAAVKSLFLQSVRLAAEAGMVGFVLHAVDGTKLQSKASTRTALSKTKLEKLLAKLEEQITAMEAEVEQHDGGEDEGYSLTTELEDRRRLKETIQQSLALLSTHATELLSSTEPDAQVVKTSAGSKLGYNGQIVVDGDNDLIVAQDVVPDPYDQGQLMPMLDQVEEEWGKVAEETVADGGYNTENTLVEADQENRSITLAAGPADAESNPGKPFHISQFSYDPKNDLYHCPEGRELLRKSRKNKGGDRFVIVYQCRAAKTCPVATDCTKSSIGRTVERSEHWEIVEQHRQKRRSDAGRALLKRRMAVAERPFACIKGPLGFTRFRSSGLTNAKAEWSWTTMAYNLTILFARWRQEVLASLSRIGGPESALEPTLS